MLLYQCLDLSKIAADSIRFIPFQALLATSARTEGAGTLVLAARYMRPAAGVYVFPITGRRRGLSASNRR